MKPKRDGGRSRTLKTVLKANLILRTMYGCIGVICILKYIYPS